MTDQQTGGLPLDQFTNATPPGWRPGITHYPFRRFKERLQLWSSTTDRTVAQQGPALAGRLTGRPFNLAMALKVQTQAGQELVGTAALAYEGEAAQVDDIGGHILVAAVPSGIAQLARLLERWYGEDEECTVGNTLDTFFDLRRGKMSLVEYVSEHEFAYEEAKTNGGLEMNNVGLSHFLMKGCGLPRDKLDHIMLLVNNDRRRYHDIKQHLMKMGKVNQPSQAPGHYGYYQDEWGAAGWDDDGWNEQS